MGKMGAVILALALGACGIEGTIQDQEAIYDMSNHTEYEKQLASYKHVRLDPEYTFPVKQFCGPYIGDLCYYGEVLQITAGLDDRGQPVVINLGMLVHHGEMLRGHPVYDIEEIR